MSVSLYITFVLTVECYAAGHGRGLGATDGHSGGPHQGGRGRLGRHTPHNVAAMSNHSSHHQGGGVYHQSSSCPTSLPAICPP
jgi:hypothetical protein